MDMLGKRVRTVAAAFCFELAVYALAVVFPKDHGWSMLFIPVLVPGSLLQFFVGGGMSMIDGLSPDWRTDLALVLGFVLNTTVMYGLCVLASRVYKQLRPIFHAR